MGRRVKVNALVLNSVNYSESSKMLTALSDRFGKISISAKGSNKPNSPFLACSQVFCYSSMELSEGRNGVYTLCECELINSFYAIREDIDIVFEAYDLAKAVLTVCQEENADEDLMRLALNTLYYLCVLSERNKTSEEGEKAREEFFNRVIFVKCVFYIRLASDQGFFDYPDSFNNPDTEKAVEHITSCDFKELFAFSLKSDAFKELSLIADKARTNVLE